MKEKMMSQDSLVSSDVRVPSLVKLLEQIHDCSLSILLLFRNHSKEYFLFSDSSFMCLKKLFPLFCGYAAAVLSDRLANMLSSHVSLARNDQQSIHHLHVSKMQVKHFYACYYS